MTKQNRGKKRRVESSSDDDNAQSDIEDATSDHFAKMLDNYASKILGEHCDETQTPLERKEPSPITPESKTVEEAQKEVEVVIFQSRKASTGNQKNSKPSNVTMEVGKKSSEKIVSKTKYTNERLNSSEVLEKLKFDVGTFGMKAFSKEEQRQQEIRRAVKLGAKPPKRKFLNYRLLMEEKKRLSEQSADKYSSSDDVHLKQEKSTCSGLPKFWKQGNKSFSPQIGKYKDGILKLSSKDIKSVNKPR